MRDYKFVKESKIAGTPFGNTIIWSKCLFPMELEPNIQNITIPQTLKTHRKMKYRLHSVMVY